MILQCCKCTSTKKDIFIIYTFEVINVVFFYVCGDFNSRISSCFDVTDVVANFPLEENCNPHGKSFDEFQMIVNLEIFDKL